MCESMFEDVSNEEFMNGSPVTSPGTCRNCGHTEHARTWYGGNECWYVDLDNLDDDTPDCECTENKPD
jgi:hypothetical protein